MFLRSMLSVNELFLAQLGSCILIYTFIRPRQCLAAVFADIFEFIQPPLKSILALLPTTQSTRAVHDDSVHPAVGGMFSRLQLT